MSRPTLAAGWVEVTSGLLVNALERGGEEMLDPYGDDQGGRADPAEDH